jgi:L-malate glycosyltransferase
MANLKPGNLKVLFLSSWFPTRILPTNGNFVEKHAESVALFCQVAILHVCLDINLRDKVYDVNRDTSNGIFKVIIYFKKPGCKFPPIAATTKAFRYLRGYFMGYKMILENFGKPDIVHCNVIYPVGIFALLFKWMFHLPYIITEHWTGYTDEGYIKPGVIRRFTSKMIVKNSSRITPVTKHLQNSLIKRGLNGIFEVVPNVTDISLFHPGSSLLRERKRLIHISDLGSLHKNSLGLLRVISKLAATRNDFELHIISDGDQALAIETAKKSGIFNTFVFFHGQKTTSEVAAMLIESDMLVMFSNFENFPCVIVEAMACGLPVISTNVGGIAEHVTSDKGILVKAGDEEGMKNAIDFALDHLPEFDKNALAAYASDHFSYETIGRRFTGIYEEVLNELNLHKRIYLV